MHKGEKGGSISDFGFHISTVRPKISRMAENQKKNERKILILL